MGQRSVERPRRVSTEFRGDEGVSGWGGPVKGGGAADASVVLGGMPRERAAITS